MSGHSHKKNGIIVIAFLILIGAAVSLPWNFTSDVTALVPGHQGSEVLDKAQRIFTEEIKSEVWLLVQGNSAEDTGQATEKLVSNLKDNKYLTYVPQFGIGLLPEIWNLYSDKSPNFLSPRQRSKLLEGNAKFIVKESLIDIYSGFGVVNKAILVEDPFGLLRDFFQVAVPNSSISIKDGSWLRDLGEGGQESLMQVQLKEGWDKRSTRAAIAKFFANNIKDLTESTNVSISRAGYFFYLDYFSNLVAKEIAVFGTISILGILSLFLLLFRSVKPLIISLSIILGSVFVALLTTQLLFGRVHLIALLFGISLLGIVVDYSLHFFARKMDDDESSSYTVIRELRPALLMSSLTTIMGFSFFLFVPLGPLSQLACFFTTGLVTAIVLIFILYPRIQMTGTTFGESMKFFDFTRWLWSEWRPVAGIITLFALLSSSIYFFTAHNFNDSVTVLQSPPKELKLDELSVRKFNGGRENSVILVKGESEEDLLEKVEELSGNFRAEGLKPISITSFVPSKKRQLENYRLQKTMYSSVDDFFDQLNLNGEPRETIKQKLKRPFVALTVGEWLNKVNISGYPFMSLHEVDREFVTAINVNAPKVTHLIPNSFSENVKLINSGDNASEGMKVIREKLILNSLFAIAFISIIVLFKYRFRGFHILFVPTLSVVVSLAISHALLGLSNLFNVLAAILIFALSLDYCFFQIEDREGRLSTSVAILASFLTSVLAFGLLGLSANQGVASFGLTLCIGLFVSLMVSPIVRRAN